MSIVQHLQILQRLATQVLEEFRLSAVPDRLTLANVQWIEGSAAVRLLSESAIEAAQKVDYVTMAAKRILDKYQFAAAGGWVAWGCQLDGSQGEVPIFKPSNPRTAVEGFKGFGDRPKEKLVKYETPAKCEALPILPYVDEETAKPIYRRYRLKPFAGETFWQVVQRSNVRISITEGLKKALALIAHGIPAIAVRGVTQWHPKGCEELHPVIKQLASMGREVFIVFDQDEKPKTQINVRKQVNKLAVALQKEGCRPRIVTWDRELGKGIDDALYGQGTNALQWLNVCLNNALTIEQYKREGAIAASLSMLRRAAGSKYSVERATEGEYLPELPELEPGAIHAIKAGMGSGKTVRIGADWVKEARSREWFTLVLAPLNSLGAQTARAWELPHIHDFGPSAEQQKALWAQVSHEKGLVMCPDSLHRLPEWFLNKPLLLVLDEANQVVNHTLQGQTLGDRWSPILERFSTIAQHAAITGAIVLSEDGLPDRAISFMERVSGAGHVRVFTHAKQSQPWRCTAYTGQASGFRAQFFKAVDALATNQQRLLVVSSSQLECRRLEQALLKQYPVKVVRIDSETNQEGLFNGFFRDPDRWLAENQPDILILSPSAKSGVSIEGGITVEEAYFSQVWGYFPALDTDSQMQLLGRYRPPVPRFLFTPPFIQSTGDESLLNPRAVKRRLDLNTRGMIGLYGLDSAISDAEQTERELEIQEAVFDYLSEAIAVAGCQKSICTDALVDRLQSAGHDVVRQTLSKSSRFVELWKQIAEELWREDAANLAAARINPETHTTQWAHDTLDGLESTAEMRCIAHKVLLRDEFPGVAFDDAETCYQAVCFEYGAMKRGVQLQARAQNLDAAKESDRKSTEAILSQHLKAAHRLPKNFLRAKLIAETGILGLLDGSTYTNQDPRAIAIKAKALYWAKEIGYYLRLQIKESQTPVEICNKLLKKLNLKAEAIARPGKRGEQSQRTYQVQGLDNPTRQRLLEAAHRRLSEAVSTIRISKSVLYDQIVDTIDQPPPDPWDERSLQDIRDTWHSCESEDEREVLRSLYPDEVLRRAIA